MPLPGGRDVWPLGVQVNRSIEPVVEINKSPSVKLNPGVHRIEGLFRWSQIPPGLKLPQEIGLLGLTVEGKTIDAPAWDATGFLWLKRDRPSEEASKDFLGIKVYAVLEDGIPLWLRTRVELIVSGKSREEEIGNILPVGWKLASLSGPIPVAVDENGRAKAQVRAGKWTLQADAFAINNLTEIRYAEGAKPAAAEQLIAFRPKPDFRMVELVGAPSIDVSQTTFPDDWRSLPVYRWDTKTAFSIAERMRGMGLQKPEGLKITRQLWLDEDGRGLTFRDAIRGNLQQIWRLDAAAGQDLGSVRTTNGGEGQLITRNPKNGAPGFEIRQRNIAFDATGRVEKAAQLSATGWQADTDALSVTLNLPPGWRLFALFGADWVAGDWLTAWTLLDLFLLLIFSLAVFRLWGFGAALLTFLAFGLSYHEPGAPRYVWLVLLVPLALLRVVPKGWGRRLLEIGKWLAVGALILVLVPFVAKQVQQALYPQLENTASPHGRGRMISATMNEPAASQENKADRSETDGYGSWSGISSDASSPTPAQKKINSNLIYDTKAKIQTGPGVPEWTWRKVSFGWNGPVQATQEVRPILISLGLERFLTILRIVLLLALAAVLLNARHLGGSLFRSSAKVTALLLAGVWLASTSVVSAQFPDQKTLDSLRERLLEPSDAYPHAADIPSVALTISEGRLIFDAEIHAAIRTAVPLPGKLPVWSPVSVTVNGKTEVSLRREDGFLWVVLEKGVHQVHVEGLLPGATEWEWTFHLPPRQVKIDAPGWTVSGVKPDGTPETQIFFALKQKSSGAAASYDRQDFQALASVERHLELGLTWQLRTTVNRLSPAGKAVSLRIPLLPGENVLSANLTPKDGFLEVRLGAQESSFNWESELPISPSLPLLTRKDDSWVESWHLVASPVWNVSISGLEPTFEPGPGDLVPVWRPWPGETATLAISRPESIVGQTVTISRGTHDMTLGKRQRVSKLELSLRCSLGEDFLIDLPPNAEVTALTLQNRPIPVRKDGSKVIIPLSPGEQNISLGWKTNFPLAFHTLGEKVALPVDSANLTSVIHLPEDRWVLWAHGPQRGPAVRFWGILICSLLAAWALGRLSLSPLKTLEWMLLAIGLTQVPLPAAFVVAGWFFLIAWRGGEAATNLPRFRFHLLQVLLIGLTVAMLGIVIAVVGEGLLGNPEMFISGNGSARSYLNWYQARVGPTLPQPGTFSVSIWWYRFLMLLWALWLAASLIRWLQMGWKHFSHGGIFRPKMKPAQASQKAPEPPPIP